VHVRRPSYARVVRLQGFVWEFGGEGSGREGFGGWKNIEKWKNHSIFLKEPIFRE